MSCPKIDAELRPCIRPAHAGDGPCHFLDAPRDPGRVERLRTTPINAWHRSHRWIHRIRTTPVSSW